jgi:glyoxylase-like metal-dependent hydrolase (beta-lactamase superfamily II)
MKLGQFEVWPLSDGTFMLDGGQMFGIVPKPLWEQRLRPDERNRVRMGLNCLLVRRGDQNILIETGVGDKMNARQTDIYGIRKAPDLLQDLDRHGVRPDKIDLVINSHLHFDHCGWNVRREGAKLVPTFARARYLVQREEWQNALAPSERDRGSYIEEFIRAAEAQTEFLEGKTEIMSGLRVEMVPGHNRSMQVIWIESEDQQMCFISDLVPTSAHLGLAWMMSFDLYPMETLANKKRLLPELAKRGTIVVFPHDPDVPWARLKEREGKYSAVPVPA